jgi:transcriptional regulator with XRE-family HTH domain
MGIKRNVKYGAAELERDFGPLTFGSILKSERLCQGESQKDFAKFLSISPQSLCDLEKGRKIPSVERAAKIAKKLKEPAETWIAIALEDLIRKAKLDYKVELSKRNQKKVSGF